MSYNELNRERLDPVVEKEIKELKGDDTKIYPKVPAKFYTQNDIREDRTYGWD